MKKIYATLLLLSISLFTYAQGPKFTIDFEGTDPLTNLPAGITSVNPQDHYETPETPGVFSDSIVAYIANNAYYFIEEGGDFVNDELFTQRNQFDNVVKDVVGNKLLQTDYTGHVIIDEAALGTDSYSIRLNISVFGHRMGGTDCGIFTITGNDNGTYKDDRITARNGGFTTGFGDTKGTGGALGFAYGQTEPPHREVVITYNDTDKFYRVYIEGVQQILSETVQTSGDWTDRKFYIGFAGRNSIGSGDGISHLDTSTGNFTSNGVRNDGRTLDLQMRMDNIEVYQRAISDAEVTTLFEGGTLSVNSQPKEIFSSYPNPVVDYLHFSSKEVYSVDIFNVLGAKVSSQKVINNVDMTQLNQGIYFVKAKNNKGLEISTIKVIKN
jgi:hypothetical protein